MSRDTAILQLMHAEGLGARTLGRILTRLAAEQYPVEDFVFSPVSELMRISNIKSEVAESIKSGQDKAEQLSEVLESHGIRIIVKETDEYPARLAQASGDTGPPVLFAKGDLDILDRNAVAFCGSRRASEEGCQLVSQWSSILAKEGINIVAGYANGIDLAAHLGAMSAGGATTIVLATGILHFKLKGAIMDIAAEDNHLIVSQFLPRVGWSVHAAMQRNLTICGLAHAVIITEPGLKGGSFEAGKTALKLGRPLFVAEYGNADKSTEGNSYFLERGAKALRRDKEGKSDLNGVFQALENDQVTTPQTSFLKHLESAKGKNDEST
jgi:DNA protecting protein DprA